MIWARILVAPFVLLVSCACLWSADQNGRKVILDESAYCRVYVEFGLDRLSPEPLKAKGQELLDKRTFGSVKKQVKTRWKHMGWKWDEAKWMDKALMGFVGLQYGNRSACDTQAWTPPPPEGWTAPEFEDSGWLRQRFPIMVGPHHGRPDACLTRQRGCFRFAFQVPDPAAAGDLTLMLLYRGGARVLVNGTEVARGHLPAGAITSEVFAEDYPCEAYCNVDKDGKIKIRKDKRNRSRYAYIGNVYGSYDAAPPHLDRKRKLVAGVKKTFNNRKAWVLNRAEWDRLQGLRDRKLENIKIPTKLLKKGRNILALEIRASMLNPIAGGWNSFVLAANETWDHCHLIDLELSDPKGTLPSALKRPAGTQVWSEDIHRRVLSTEFGDPGAPRGTVRFAGALGGSFSAQIVVATDKPLTGLKTVLSDLKSSDGKMLPATAVKIRAMKQIPLANMNKLGFGRGGGDLKHVLHGAVLQGLKRHGPDEARKAGLSKDKKIELAKQIGFFDHVSEEPFAGVAKDSSRPVCLTLNVPVDTAPGLYKGTLTVSAAELKPVTLPVEAEVFGWVVPTGNFQTCTGVEQYPYSVAEYYKVKLWSEEHFKVMEPTFRQLGRIGNDWLFLPIINWTEFGNMDRSMLGITRKKDGSFAFDFTLIDRYLDLATKHMKNCKAIVAVIMMGAAGNPSEIRIMNEATGKQEVLDLTSKSKDYVSGWKAISRAIHGHMKKRGLEKSLYWGYAWDSEADPNLPALLSQITPDVRWASGTHGHAAGFHYRVRSFIYKLADLVPGSRMGWKRKDHLLINPRGGGNIVAISGFTNPFTYRLALDRAIVSGVSGLGRIGADDWANIFFRGVKSGGFLRPGMPVSTVLYAGKKGAETSVRFESMVEGLQEAEARIFLEQAMVRKKLPEGLAAKAKKVLNEHNRATFYIPSIRDNPFATEYTIGWRERSKALFAVAAEAAKVVGLDINKDKVTVKAPARGKPTVAINLRNWTSAPRKWTAEADQAWIKPAAPTGELSGTKDLIVTIDTTTVKPESKVKGTLTITDVASGLKYPVAVEAEVSRVFEFVAPDANPSTTYWKINYMPHKGRIPFDVTAGKTFTKEIMIHNRAAAEIAYTVKPSVPWIKAEPKSATVAARSPIVLKVTAAPPDAASAYHEASLAITETGGQAKVEAPLAIHVIPEYTKPNIPAGEAVPMTGAIYKSVLKKYSGGGGPVSVGLQDVTAKMKGPRYMPRTKPFSRVMRGAAPYQAVFNLEGKGYKAFSAQVGFPDKWDCVVGMWSRRGAETDRLNFEIYVDGKLKSQSGLIGPKDDFRLITVEGLEKAKEMRLVVRPLSIPNNPLCVFWFDPVLYK